MFHIFLLVGFILTIFPTGAWVALADLKLLYTALTGIALMVGSMFAISVGAT